MGTDGDRKTCKHFRLINQNRSAKLLHKPCRAPCSSSKTPKKTCSQQTGQNERVENTVEGKTEAASYRKRHSNHREIAD